MSKLLKSPKIWLYSFVFWFIAAVGVLPVTGIIFHASHHFNMFINEHGYFIVAGVLATFASASVFSLFKHLNKIEVK